MSEVPLYTRSSHSHLTVRQLQLLGRDRAPSVCVTEARLGSFPQARLGIDGQMCREFLTELEFPPLSSPSHKGVCGIACPRALSSRLWRTRFLPKRPVSLRERDLH